MINLTQKQEDFCLAYVECGNASKAYRQVYDAANMKPETIHVKASELLSNGKVAVRIVELRQQSADRLDITVEKIAAQLSEDRQLAHEVKQAGAAVSASMGMAKLFGFLTDRHKVQSQIGYVSDEPLSDDEWEAKFGNNGS